MLKHKLNSALRREQAAWSEYLNVIRLLEASYRVMQNAWNDRCIAEEKMNEEYENVRIEHECYREIWGEYKCIAKRNGDRITSLRIAADHEETKMRECFKKSDEEFEHGNTEVSPLYYEMGKEHENYRDEFNRKIRVLRQEIQDAKAEAKRLAIRNDTKAFKSARQKFQRTKNRHEFARAEFNSLKEERDRAKANYERLQSEYKELKAEYERLKKEN